MKFRISIAATAQREINEFLAYAADYDDAYAVEQSRRLDAVLWRELATSPLRYAFFRLTGPPHRARLFEAGRRTK